MDILLRVELAGTDAYWTGWSSGRQRVTRRGAEPARLGALVRPGGGKGAGLLGTGKS